MTTPTPETSPEFIVLINDEEQYSLWSQTIPVPAGWRVVHGPTTKAACLEYVDSVWLDLTPRSVRMRLQRESQPGGSAE